MTLLLEVQGRGSSGPGSFLSSAALWGFAGKGDHPEGQQGTVATRWGRPSGHKQWLHVLNVWRRPGRQP